jgi:hypothetical protein
MHTLQKIILVRLCNNTHSSQVVVYIILYRTYCTVTAGEQDVALTVV